VKNLDPVLTEHAYDLRSRQKAERSIDNRDRNVTLFAEWCDAPSVADVKPGHVTRWLSARAEAGDAPETVLTRFGHLRAFYRWCEREEIVAKSPLANLHEPTAETQPVPVLSDDQLRALFGAVKGKTFLERRDFAMLAFLADTGVRVGELVALTVDHVDFKTSTAAVVGKFGRRRVVAFGPKAGKALLAYLRVRAQHRLAGDARLWLGQRGR
jgi:site-specific recombinase XerD